MSTLVDLEARERFRTEWRRNFAVSANAGSGKTTAISERLAAMALSEEAASVLPKTAVVTFTRKAAQQIGQRARAVLLRRLTEEGRGDLGALDYLERAFFGTIHSFCLLLARRYGQALGINLNPAVVAADDERCWEEFLEQDAMTFSALAPAQVDAFLRHVPLEAIFDLAKNLDTTTARTLAAKAPPGPPSAPSEAVLDEILGVAAKGNGRKNIELSQAAARTWWENWQRGRGFLPLFQPVGSAEALKTLAKKWMSPLKSWLADAGAALAAELAERYRAYRFERGVQTYADQIDAALAVLRDRPTLERIRGEGWRVILDEAQDTDPQQFAVLVEIARPPGAEPHQWPGTPGAPGPRDGHFCMVGDGQQSIYGSRADIRNFVRHLNAFAAGHGGELLSFQVTFRAPHRIIDFLNAGLPDAFGEGRDYNWGLPPAEGAEKPYLQVEYNKLAAGPANAQGWVSRLPLVVPATRPRAVDDWMKEEAGQVAAFLRAHEPRELGARHWGEVCVLAPRNGWLTTVQKIFEDAGLKVALQTRKRRNGDNPVYGWMAGLLAVVCDPGNRFEWFGVLRELFGLSDAELAAEANARGGFLWETPEEHSPAVADAIGQLRPWILRVDDDGLPLGDFARGLAETAGLAEKARAFDPSGGLEGELTRLLVRAATLGIEGAGAREWLAELLNEIDEGRPSGAAEEGAVNLLTAHSAKGLEWPVVIALGLWRKASNREETGLRLVRDGTRVEVFLDQASLPEDTKLAREREQWRELTRLMYVTLTRPRHRLILPWGEGFGEGQRRIGVSFAELWGNVESWMRLPAIEETLEPVTSVTDVARAETTPDGEQLELGDLSPADASDVATEETHAAVDVRPLPTRVLPHQLAEKTPDRVRGLRHEASSEDLLARRDGDEAIDYGLWWHETMEFWPWGGAREEADAAQAAAIARAEPQGFATRAREELERLRASEAWPALNDPRWTRLAELAVFAPLSEASWMDGVVDFVLHDAETRTLWIYDWKTNRRRAGESDEAMAARLAGEYRPQLEAYGRAAREFFLDHEIRLFVYATALGQAIELPRG